MWEMVRRHWRALIIVLLLCLASVPLAKLYVWVTVVIAQRPAIVAAGPVATPDEESHFAVPIEMTYADLAKVVGNGLPPVFDGEYPLHVSGLEHEGVTVHVVRGEISFIPAGDKLNFTIPVSGTGRFHCIIHPGWKHFHVSPPVPFSQSIDLAGHVTGSIALRVNPNWTVSAETPVTLQLDKAEGTVAHFGHVSARGEVQKLFDRAVPPLLQRATADALAKLDTRARVSDAWAKL